MKRYILNQPYPRRNGFALIATISVMVLLVLIALAMLSLSTIELRQNTNAKNQEEAQANARLALMMAIEDLQRHAGADRRVTAPASILSDSVDSNKRNWTTVWDTSNWDVKDPVNSRDSQGYLRTLVSQRSIPTNLSRASVTVDLESAVPTGDDAWVQLVGGGSVDDAEDQVYAEKVDLTVGNTQGSYAYWVGDEGVKARFDVDVADDAPSETWASAGRMGVPAGTGIHKITDMGDYIDYLPDGALAGDLGKFISQRTLERSNLDQDVVKDNFHHVTTTHTGLLVDNRWGGIRRDLSTAFEMDAMSFAGIDEFNSAEEQNLTDAYSSFTPGNLNSNPLYYSADTDESLGFLYEIPVDGSRRYRGPTWDLLRNHYRTYKKERNDLNFRGVSVSSGSDALVAHGVMPLSYNREPGDVNNRSLGSFHIHPHSDARQDRGNFYPIVSNHGVAGSYMGLDEGAKNEPTVQKVTPQLLRMVLQFGMVRKNNDYYITINPFFTIHNPYNYPIEFYSMSVDFSYIFYLMQMRLTNYTNSSGVDRSVNIDFNISNARDESGSNTTKMQSFRLQPSASGNNRLDPGEVKVMSVDGGFQETDGANYIIPMKLQYDEVAGVAVGGSRVVNISDGVEANSQMTFSASINTGIQIPTLYTRLHHPIAAEGGAYDLFDPIHVTDNLSTILDRELTTLIQSIRITPSRASTTVTRSENSIPELGEGSTLPLFIFDVGLKDFSGDAAVFSDFNYRSLAVASSDYDKSHDVSPNWELSLTAGSIGGLQLAGADGVSAFWGEGKSASSGGSSRIVLFDLPRSPMVSLGGLQHADTSKYNNHAARSIGNSRPQVGQPDLSKIFHQFSSARFSNTDSHHQFDTSWAANEALWDRFYFSGINWGDISGQPYDSQEQAIEALIAGDVGRVFSNPRMQLLKPISDTDKSELMEADGYRMLGEYIGMKGAFNVNSTSVEAWKAVLASMSGRQISYLDGNFLSNLDIGSDDTPISRFSTPGGDDSDDYAGFRALEDSELTSLAEEIVEQVKLRGPFMGLSDFVNRRLVSGVTGQAGALQAAIDASDINNSVEIGATAGNGLEQSSPSSSEGLARHLDQGDVVNLLGPVMATRSDTFRIRAYGDSKDANGRVVARAWCEAVVQRTPELIIDSDEESTIQNPAYPRSNPTDEPILRQWIPNDNLPATVDEFGRKFKVLSFRWLAADDV